MFSQWSLSFMHKQVKCLQKTLHNLCICQTLCKFIWPPGWMNSPHVTPTHPMVHTVYGCVVCVWGVWGVCVRVGGVCGMCVCMCDSPNPIFIVPNICSWVDNVFLTFLLGGGGCCMPFPSSKSPPPPITDNTLMGNSPPYPPPLLISHSSTVWGWGRYYL